MAKPSRRHRGFGGIPKIASRLRFDRRDAEELDPDAVAFGKAMAAYRERWGQTNTTAGEILDVAIDLGYRCETRDYPIPPGASAKAADRRQQHPNLFFFEEAVQEFAAALARYKKRQGRPYPMWSEVLEVLRSLGWQKPDPAAAAYLARWNCADPTASELLEHALGLGYQYPGRAFAEALAAFRHPLRTWKSHKKLAIPALPALLALLRRLGWTRPA